MKTPSQWGTRLYPSPFQGGLSNFKTAVQVTGRQMGKTMTATRHLAGAMARLASVKKDADPLTLQGKFMRSDWGREMGGLHKERWAAYEPDAVTQLGDIARDA